MMINKILSNNRRIIDSGSVFAYDTSASVEINEEIQEQGFRVKISFENTETDNRALQRRTNLDEGLVEIKCVNFNNSLGTGTTSPIEIGNIDDKSVSITFWVFLLGTLENGARRIDYTFFVDE